MLAATHRHLLPLALALAAGCQGVATDGQTEVATDTFRCGHACTQLPIYTGVPTGLALTDHDTCVLRGKTPDPYFFCAGAEEIDSNGNVVHTIGNAWEFTLYDPHNPHPQSVAGGRDEV